MRYCLSVTTAVTLRFSVLVIFSACGESPKIEPDARQLADAALSGQPCPSNMRLVDTGNWSFCIDQFETTIADILAVQDLVPNVSELPSVCPVQALAASFTNPLLSPEDHPARLSFCEAATACSVQGKRLCGSLGGGAVPYGRRQEPDYSAAFSADISEWHYVCTNAGTQRFSYGDTFDASLCKQREGDAPFRSVGAELACEGGVTGVFDMIGNAWEWTNSCFAGLGVNYYCRARGGGASDGFSQEDLSEEGCHMPSEVLFDSYLPFTFKAATARCCATPTAASAGPSVEPKQAHWPELGRERAP